MPKHIQIQVGDGGGEWGAAGDIQLLPDDRPSMTDFVRDQIWNDTLKRMVTIREPELFFETWVKLGPDHGQRVIDVDSPDTATAVQLPIGGPLIAKLPANILLKSEERGVDEP